MALFSIADVCFSGIAAAVPSQTVRNEDLDLLKTSDAKGFVRAVGIGARRVAPPEICASDLCLAAAQRLLRERDVSPDEIGLLVFVTQTPDHPLPGNSMLAQRRLGLPVCTWVVDVNQGCAGYVYGLAIAASLMSAARIGKALLLVGDTLTRLLSCEDRSTIPIFSDAGSATLLELGADMEPMYFNLGGEGQGAEVIQVRAGGARQPFGPDSLAVREEEPNVARAPVHLAMRGMDVLHYTMKYVVPNIHELLDFARASIDTPDYWVFHQASRILNDCLLKRLGIAAEKAPQSLLEYGNTSCATIPVTICARLADTLANGRRRFLLCGFGAGFSWGSALVSSQSVICPEILEVDGTHGV
jgi:3-oxoacyl-[acyl-carrier-protein] synthase-3